MILLAAGAAGWNNQHDWGHYEDYSYDFVVTTRNISKEIIPRNRLLESFTNSLRANVETPSTSSVEGSRPTLGRLSAVLGRD